MGQIQDKIRGRIQKIQGRIQWRTQGLCQGHSHGRRLLLLLLLLPTTWSAPIAASCPSFRWGGDVCVCVGGGGA